MAEFVDEKISAEVKLDDKTLLALDGQVVNASGHRDQLQRGYGLLSVCGLALSIDNAWVAMGATLNVAIYNGGPPGIIYEFITAAVYYAFIAASIAELASAIPSSGGIYHWASVTPGPRYGRVIGFFAGWVNFFGWQFALASIAYIMGEIGVQMYALYHPDYIFVQWNIFVGMVIITWLYLGITIFFNRFLPILQQFGFFIVSLGGVVVIIVVVSMTREYASSSFVWTAWDNQTGWGNGVAFLTGVLNGAFTIGTPDAVTHMAEELPNPRRDLPRAVAAQLGLGTIYTFCFLIAILYGINDLNAVLSSQGSFPLAEIFRQATGSRAATFGLLFIVFLSLTPCLIGLFLTVSRTWWTLARDNATPFASIFSNVNERLSCPIESTILAGVFTTGFCAISLGSKTAFVDLVGSFVILTTVSYLLAIGPHLLTKRSNVIPGPFWMGKGGYVVNAIAVLVMIFFNVIYCFPYGLPTSTVTMNYASVILVGVMTVAATWWFAYAAKHYKQPLVQLVLLEGQIRRPQKVE